MKREIRIGGAAQPYGVMMITPRKISYALRLANGRILTLIWPINLLGRRWQKLPFLRGILALFFQLSYQLKVAYQFPKKLSQQDFLPALKTSTWSTVGGIAIVILAFLGSRFFSYSFMGIILSYIWFIGFFILAIKVLIPPIVKQYHGAEHKAINCLKAGWPVEEAKKFSPLAVSCGSTFVIVFSFFLLLGDLWWFLVPPVELWLKWVWTFFAFGASYEIIKVAEAHYHQPRVKKIIKPFFILQKQVVLEPTNEQLEVAIKAVQAVQND